MGLLSGVPVVGVRRRRPSTRRVLHRVMAFTMVAVMSVVLVTPARAQFDWANPAAWAVVVEMTKVISTMVSVKRQVENVRNLARSEALGAFAPLVDGLRPVGESMARVQGVVNDAANLRLRPGYTIGEEDLEPLESIPFNQVIQACGDGSPAHLCMPGAEEVFDYQSDAGIAALHQAVVRDSVPDFVPDSFDVDTVLARHRENRENRVEAEFKAAQQQEILTAELQSHVESMMGLVEEFYGCIEMPDGGGQPNPPRPYCVTNDGKGMGDELEDGNIGTVGLSDDLTAKLETIQRQPDGNASQTQLQVIQTRAAMYRARATGMAAQMRAYELEQQAQARLLAEARQRRGYELFNATLRCQADTGSPYARFIPSPDTLEITDANADVDIYAAGHCEVPPGA